MSTFIKVNDRTPITSISNAMTATESGRRSASRTIHIMAETPPSAVVSRSSRRLTLRDCEAAGLIRIPADPRLILHFVDHAREILITIDRRPRRIDLMRACGHRHRRAKFGGFLENQSEIFVHESQWKLR